MIVHGQSRTAPFTDSHLSALKLLLLFYLWQPQRNDVIAISIWWFNVDNITLFSSLLVLLHPLKKSIPLSNKGHWGQLTVSRATQDFDLCPLKWVTYFRPSSITGTLWDALDAKTACERSVCITLPDSLASPAKISSHYCYPVRKDYAMSSWREANTTLCILWNTKQINNIAS